MTSEQRAFACAHLGLAHQQAHRFARRWSMAVDDLIGPAYEGLCKGAIGFDPSLGHLPSSYLVPKVKGELLHYLRDTGFSLRISHRLRELWIKARKHVAQGLSDQQIADQLDVPLERWLECRRACGQRPIPLHELQRD
jgi:DNA-directed RNA polymerase specialized sigma subunit